MPWSISINFWYKLVNIIALFQIFYLFCISLFPVFHYLSCTSHTANSLHAVCGLSSAQLFPHLISNVIVTLQTMYLSCYLFILITSNFNHLHTQKAEANRKCKKKIQIDARRQTKTLKNLQTKITKKMSTVACRAY